MSSPDDPVPAMARRIHATCLLRVAAIILCLLASASAAQAASSTTEHRVTFTGYGPAHVGMSLEALRKAVGAQLLDDPLQEDACRYVSAPRSPGVAYMLIDGKVARIDVFAPSGVQAFAGGRVGASKASLLRSYPTSKVTPHFYDSGGAYVTLLSNDGKHGIRFEIEDDRVSGYYAGTIAAIQYVEGCE